MLRICGIFFAFDLHYFRRGKEFEDLEKDLVIYYVSPISKVPLFFTLSSWKSAYSDHMLRAFLCKAVLQVGNKDAA